MEVIAKYDHSTLVEPIFKDFVQMKVAISMRTS